MNELEIETLKELPTQLDKMKGQIPRGNKSDKRTTNQITDDQTAVRFSESTDCSTTCNSESQDVPLIRRGPKNDLDTKTTTPKENTFSNPSVEESSDEMGATPYPPIDYGDDPQYDHLLHKLNTPQGRSKGLSKKYEVINEGSAAMILPILKDQCTHRPIKQSDVDQLSRIYPSFSSFFSKSNTLKAESVSKYIEDPELDDEAEFEGSLPEVDPNYKLDSTSSITNSKRYTKEMGETSF